MATFREIPLIIGQSGLILFHYGKGLSQKICSIPILKHSIYKNHSPSLSLYLTLPLNMLSSLMLLKNGILVSSSDSTTTSLREASNYKTNLTNSWILERFQIKVLTPFFPVFTI